MEKTAMNKLAADLRQYVRSGSLTKTAGLGGMYQAAMSPAINLLENAAQEYRLPSPPNWDSAIRELFDRFTTPRGTNTIDRWSYGSGTPDLFKRWVAPEPEIPDLSDSLRRRFGESISPVIQDVVSRLKN